MLKITVLLSLFFSTTLAQAQQCILVKAKTQERLLVRLLAVNNESLFTDKTNYPLEHIAYLLFQKEDDANTPLCNSLQKYEVEFRFDPNLDFKAEESMEKKELSQVISKPIEEQDPLPSKSQSVELPEKQTEDFSCYVVLNDQKYKAVHLFAISTDYLFTNQGNIPLEDVAYIAFKQEDTSQAKVYERIFTYGILVRFDGKLEKPKVQSPLQEVYMVNGREVNPAEISIKSIQQQESNEKAKKRKSKRKN